LQSSEPLYTNWGWWISKEVVQTSKSCAFHDSCVSSWDSARETTETEPSESPTVIDVAEEFQSRKRHMEELTFSSLISLKENPAPKIHYNTQIIRTVNTKKVYTFQNISASNFHLKKS
jgi:hypothetical protein